MIRQVSPMYHNTPRNQLAAPPYLKYRTKTGNCLHLVISDFVLSSQIGGLLLLISKVPLLLARKKQICHCFSNRSSMGDVDVGGGGGVQFKSPGPR